MPIELLRVLLGLLALFFAYALGRTVARLRKYKRPLTKALTWVLRTAVCLFAVLWQRGLDVTSIVFLILSAATFGIGYYLEWRPRHVEEIHIVE
ncbi:MAG TPA: hypothetical protein PLK67_05555 [Bryobacteraceae bacterium]|nr:hypothetical protein [Bryobacteraceae bacterium]HOQ44360.1 hypothetical protein [Bryobacteraceae bacterium]